MSESDRKRPAGREAAERPLSGPRGCGRMFHDRSPNRIWCRHPVIVVD